MENERSSADFPEDERTFSPVSPTSRPVSELADDEGEAGHADAPSSARGANGPTQPQGTLPDVLNSALSVAATAGWSVALSTGAVGHAVLSSLSNSAGGDRPAGPALPVANALRWWETELPQTLLPEVLGSVVSNVRAASGAAAAGSVAARSGERAPLRGLHLITEAVPFAQGAVEQAFSRLLTRMEGLGTGRPPLNEAPIRWIPWIILTVAGGAVATAERWRRWGTDLEGAPRTCSAVAKIGRHGLPGLPGPR
jgi:hypothetical protein